MIWYIFEHLRKNHYDELVNLSVPMRQSKLLELYIDETPLVIKDEDVFAGWFGMYDEEPLQDKASAPTFPYVSLMNDQQKVIHENLTKDLHVGIWFNIGHTCVDYEGVINNGLIHYVNLVNAELKKEPNNEYLLAMKVSLLAVPKYAKRFEKLACEKLATTTNITQKERLNKMVSALKRVPYYPAQNLYEAVQCLWLMHSVVPMSEMCWASISIGRLDQFLFKYYQKAVQDGVSKQEMKDIFKHLFFLLDNYGDGACTVNIGGLDADGNDMTNDLSRLLIEVEKEMLLRAPIFAARISPKTPEDVFDSLIDFDLFKVGQPTFYGELPCREAVCGRGIDKAEASQFCANSCMGLILPGKEFADMWAIKFNMHLPLELAVNDGKPLFDELKFELKTKPEPIDCYQTLLRKYNEYLTEILNIAIQQYNIVALEQELNGPAPLVSAITEGCIESRRDRCVGAKYNTTTIETIGMINTCDAIQAINELVFERQEYTLADIIASAKSNHQDVVLRNKIIDCKKFGNNDEQTNLLANTVGNFVSVICKSNNHDNVKYIPSLHTIDVNVEYGLELNATLDGRKLGEPVNKNANPSGLIKKLEYTDQALSAVAINQVDFSGGQPIDMYFDKSWFRTKETRDKIKNLIKTYFQLGGLQFQVNSVDIDLLEKAHQDPDAYPQVIVRKGGYSVRFNEMSPEAREDFIAMAKKF